MNTQPEALRLADMIERYNAGVHSQAIVEDYCKAAAELRRLHADVDRLTEALRRALEIEPFEYWNAVEGWVKIDEVRDHFDAVGCGTIYKSAGEGRVPLYTAPKQWVGLTDAEHDNIKHNYHNMTWTLEMFGRAIEQALKEKNT